jgi:hypothetical protein
LRQSLHLDDSKSFFLLSAFRQIDNPTPEQIVPVQLIENRPRLWEIRIPNFELNLEGSHRAGSSPLKHSRGFSFVVVDCNARNVPSEELRTKTEYRPDFTMPCDGFPKCRAVVEKKLSDVVKTFSGKPPLVAKLGLPMTLPISRETAIGAGSLCCKRYAA